MNELHRVLRPTVPNPLDHVPAGALRALNYVMTPLVRRGLASPPAFGVGATVVATTGHKSGVPREVPLAGARMGNSVVVSTVRGDSQWVRNLEADPNAQVWLDGRRRSASASVRRLPGLSLALLRLD